MTQIKDIVTIDIEIMVGTPVFKNTRVPIESLFQHLEKDVTLSDFLDDFPSVSREQAEEALRLSSRILSSGMEILF